jgi:hypothetical protein
VYGRRLEAAATAAGVPVGGANGHGGRRRSPGCGTRVPAARTRGRARLVVAPSPAPGPLLQPSLHGKVPGHTQRQGWGCCRRRRHRSGPCAGRTVWRGAPRAGAGAGPLSIVSCPRHRCGRRRCRGPKPLPAARRGARRCRHCRGAATRPAPRRATRGAPTASPAPWSGRGGGRGRRRRRGWGRPPPTPAGPRLRGGGGGAGRAVRAGGMVGGHLGLRRQPRPRPVGSSQATGLPQRQRTTSVGVPPPGAVPRAPLPAPSSASSCAAPSGGSPMSTVRPAAGEPGGAAGCSKAAPAMPRSSERNWGRGWGLGLGGAGSWNPSKRHAGWRKRGRC